MSDLTPKEARLVAEYVLHGSVKRAALAVDVTPVTAGKWLRRPRVQAEVCRHMATYQARFDVTQARVIDEMAAIAYAPITAEAEPTTPIEGGGGGETDGTRAGTWDVSAENSLPSPVRTSQALVPYSSHGGLQKYLPAEVVRHYQAVAHLQPVRAADKLKALDMLARTKVVDAYASSGDVQTTTWNVQINL